uniref:Uncharacterized protein n=1 Tax=Trichinella nativa TaxID=6335 RepID=A0A0V1KI55_9BILA
MCPKGPDPVLGSSGTPSCVWMTPAVPGQGPVTAQELPNQL